MTRVSGTATFSRRPFWSGLQFHLIQPQFDVHAPFSSFLKMSVSSPAMDPPKIRACISNQPAEVSLVKEKEMPPPEEISSSAPGQEVRIDAPAVVNNTEVVIVPDQKATPRKFHSCKDCRKVFLSTEAFKKHNLLQHKGESVKFEPELTREEDGPSLKSGLDEDVEHVNRSAAADDDGIRCSLCPASFTLRAGLKFHMKRCHSAYYP